jgi:hypothetical protein
MTTTQPKPVPKGLAARGRSLWREVTQNYSMNPAEAVILHELCRVVDVLDRLNTELAATDVLVGGSRGQLRPNPLFATIVEFEKMADLLSRRLALPDDYAGVKRSASAAAAGKASAAAKTRWQGA